MTVDEGACRGRVREAHLARNRGGSMLLGYYRCLRADSTVHVSKLTPITRKTSMAGSTFIWSKLVLITSFSMVNLIVN